ncbi:flagellin [Natronorubrum sp. FCH18a]|uniref:flagellin n=1 Tax=Natronorubrum sp. FCH18a TaxID=3447018 RepID=UPI003F512E21
MGFSTSGATAVILVGMLVAVGIAYPVLQGAHENRLSAIDDRDERTLELRNSDIELEEARFNETSDELTVNVTNTGSTTLSVPATDLLVDGVYRSVGEDETAVDGIADRELWQPGETLSITVVIDDTDDPPERVKVVTEHGIAETAEVTHVE